MRLLAFLALIAFVASAPTSNETSAEDEKLIIDLNFFPEMFKIYTAEHDVIRILLPLNTIFADDIEDSSEESKYVNVDDKVVFFVEADLTNGVEYKGLSVYKKGNVTKILPTGTSAAAATDDSKIAYFGATDGLYKYNDKTNTAEKYGPITDNIIDLAKVNGSDVIYILTNQNELFKVTEDGTKKEKISDVVGAKQIILDYSNNLYFYSEDKKFYVISEGGIKKIEGLPTDVQDIRLINAPIILDDGIPAIIGNKSYVLYANGTSDLALFEFVVKPSAYSMEGTLLQYYAYNKSIYEYNLLAIIESEAKEIKEEMDAFLHSNKEQIETIARSRIEFKGLNNTVSERS